jgi:adenylosuccinate lyase
MRLLFNILSLLNLVVVQEITMHIMWLIQIDWRKFGGKFVEDILGLHHSFPTTQIEHYDHFAAFFDALKESILLSSI